MSYHENIHVHISFYFIPKKGFKHSWLRYDSSDKMCVISFGKLFYELFDPDKYKTNIVMWLKNVRHNKYLYLLVVSLDQVWELI